jgi:hypothetical protein
MERGKGHTFCSVAVILRADANLARRVFSQSLLIVTFPSGLAVIRPTCALRTFLAALAPAGLIYPTFSSFPEWAGAKPFRF